MWYTLGDLNLNKVTRNTHTFFPDTTDVIVPNVIIGLYILLLETNVLHVFYLKTIFKKRVYLTFNDRLCR